MVISVMSCSKEMVRLYKEQFGRGPTKARAAWAGPDTLVCTLEDTLTPAERNLLRLGERWLPAVYDEVVHEILGVCEKDAVSASDDGLRIKSLGETYARRKVVSVWVIDSCAAL